MQCTIDTEAGTFTLIAGTWSGTYPLAELDRWRAFYREQRERFPKSGDSYDRTIAALDALAAKHAG